MYLPCWQPQKGSLRTGIVPPTRPYIAQAGRPFGLGANRFTTVSRRAVAERELRESSNRALCKAETL